MTRPILVLNPRSDETFVELAERITSTGVETPEALERELRVRYPTAVVRARSLSSEPIVTWYVYREGTWVPND